MDTQTGMEKMQIVVQNIERKPEPLQVIEATRTRPPCPSNSSSNSRLVRVSEKKVNKVWGLVVSEFHREISCVDFIIALIAYCVLAGITAISARFLLKKDQRPHGHEWLIAIEIVAVFLCTYFSFLASKRLRIWWFDIDSQKGMSECDMAAAGSIVHRDIESSDSRSCSILAVIPE